MQKRKNNYSRSVIDIVLVIVLLFGALFVPSFFVGHAGAVGETAYSDVLADLQKDETFDVSKYPENTEDFSLQVIQIAESTDGELLIYVYQPSGQTKDLRASSINISTAINDSFSPKNYTLTFINSNGVFYKYSVNDFELLPDAMRYYSIVSIFRPFDETIDEQASNGNTVDEVSYEVGKLVTATTVNGVVSYTCLDTETILVIDKYVGFIRYDNGFTLYNKYCDSHYIAFSTDKPMDKLMEAEVYFVRRDITTRINLTGEHLYSQGELVSDTVLLSEIDKGHNSPNGWFQNSYEWQRIETVSSFKQGLSDYNIELTEETVQALDGKQWVLRFYESDVNTRTAGSYSFRDSTEVTDVTILRLKFETDGDVYNLGVVDNKQSGDSEPDNEDKPWWEKLIEALIGLVLGVLAVVLIVVLFPYIVTALVWVFKALVWLLKYIFIGVWYVIASPYYLIKYIKNN